MTTQREPDTSAEGLRKTLVRAADYIEAKGATTIEGVLVGDGEEIVAALRALADAAGQAAPVPPPVEGLETKFEDVLRFRGRADDAGRLARDFAKVHDRAEGLAKEVERLTAVYFDSYEQGGKWRQRAEAAEAKLAVYEAPVAGGGVAAAVKELSTLSKDWLGTNTASGTFFAGVVDLLVRLSREKAEAEAREAKLREALKPFAKYADAIDQVASDAGATLDHEWVAITEPSESGRPPLTVGDLRQARAALASSSPTKEKSDG